MVEDTSPPKEGRDKEGSGPRVRMHLPPFEILPRPHTPPLDLSLSADGELATPRAGFPLTDMCRELEEGKGSPKSQDSPVEIGPSNAHDSISGTPFSSGTSTPYEPGVGVPRRRWNQELAAFPGAFPWDSVRQLLVPKKHNRSTSVVNMGDPVQRQGFCMKLCRALMLYGAPTHRLEQCMKTTAKHLKLEGQFLYLPGCMICSFDDRELRTTEVKLVREKEGINLEKLGEVVNIYREAVHDQLDVEEAVQKLEGVMARAEGRGPWRKVIYHGLAAAAVGPFAFSARPIDLGPIFILGCGVGVLQNLAAAKSEGFSSLFEVTAAFVSAFASRGLGSIRYTGEPVFCFSAMAQSATALILPGYIILCASLELQNRNIIAGSVRMVYAIIYALMLGFGTLIGAVMYGVIDKNATSDVSCPPARWMGWWDHHNDLFKLPSVIAFTLCLILINQARWCLEMFVMIFISFTGYLISSYSAEKFENNVQVASALGAFTVGLFGNGYSRYSGAIGAVIMMPAIFVQVPSGIAASGSLVSGLTSADQITGNQTAPMSVITNGTSGFADAQDVSKSAHSPVYGGTVFNLGFGMVQVALGISVGLLCSSYALFPFGKKRSGVFSF